MNDTLTIKDRIDVLCKERGTNISSLEKAVGFGSGTINKWDHQAASAEKLAKVADYFGVSVDYLLGREIDYDHRNALTEQLLREPQLGLLMDMARFCTEDELEILKGMIRSWKKN